MPKASPNAAAELMEMIEDDMSEMDGDDMMGATDCPEGCQVEPDGTCSHGYQSAGITLGVI